MTTLRRKLLSSASALALLAAMAAPASADFAGTSTTQTATHPDAAVFWTGQANGATSCNAVSQTSASDTLTITPPSGNYAYLTALTVQFSTDATGATAVPTIAITGVAGSGAAPYLSAATTLSTTGYHSDIVIPFPVGGLRGSTPGGAITLVPSAAMGAHSILCMTAVGYFNAN